MNKVRLDFIAVEKKLVSSTNSSHVLYLVREKKNRMKVIYSSSSKCCIVIQML